MEMGTVKTTKVLPWVRVIPTLLNVTDLPDLKQVRLSANGMGAGRTYGNSLGDGMGRGPDKWDRHGDGWGYGWGYGNGSGGGHGSDN